MKVLQFGKYYPPEVGGIEWFVYDLTEELNRRGINSDVLCVNRGCRSIMERYVNYTVTRAATIGSVASAPVSPAFFYFAKRLCGSYDIIHVHLPNPVTSLALFLAPPQSRIVLHWHSDIVKQKRLLKIYHPFLIQLMRRADIIIASSSRYAIGSEYLMRFKSKVRIVPLGINPNRLKTPDEKSVGRVRAKFRGKKLIFSLGRLSPYKGFEYLIEASTFLPDDVVILIGGEGGLRKKFEGMIERLGVKDKVILVGRIPEEDLPIYYAASDVFVLPSIQKNEAFGLVQLEAMHFGKPVVSTDIEDSGVSWVNRNRVSGLVVQPRDASGIASAVTTVLDDRDLYAHLSAGARKRVQTIFDIREVGREIVDIYDEMCRNESSA